MDSREKRRLGCWPRLRFDEKLYMSLQSQGQRTGSRSRLVVGRLLGKSAPPTESHNRGSIVSMSRRPSAMRMISIIIVFLLIFATSDVEGRHRFAEASGMSVVVYLPCAASRNQRMHGFEDLLSSGSLPAGRQAGLGRRRVPPPRLKRRKKGPVWSRFSENLWRIKYTTPKLE